MGSSDDFLRADWRLFCLLCGQEAIALSHSGVVRKQTLDVQLHIGTLEIPGSMLRIAPE
jgi:hypothetical protein